MNKKFLILSIPIVIFLTLLGGLFAFHPQKPASNGQKPPVAEGNPTQPTGKLQEVQTPDTDTAVDTSNWKTYRNEEYGFELKYPEDWEFRSTKPSALGGKWIVFDPIISDVNEPQLNFNLNIHRSTKTPREWAKANYVEERKDNPDIVVSEERDINGYPVLFIINRSMYNDTVNYINRTYIISHDGLVLYIYFRPVEANLPSYEKYIPVFDHMVSSIKF